MKAGINSIFLVPALSLAQLFRMREQRRLDLGVWVGLASSGLVLIPLAPFLGSARETSQLLSGIGLSVWSVNATWQEFFSIPVMYFGLLVIISLGFLHERKHPDSAGTGQRAREEE